MEDIVHLEYLSKLKFTEDERDFDTGHCDDMGWFFLNTKEYNYFKSQLREIEFKIKG